MVRLSGGVLGWMCVVDGGCGDGVLGVGYGQYRWEESDVGEAGCLSEVR